MAGCDTACTEKLEIFEILTLLFCSFFRGNWKKKWSTKKRGSPKLQDSKPRAKLTQWLPALYVLRKLSKRTRSMHGRAETDSANDVSLQSVLITSQFCLMDYPFRQVYRLYFVFRLPSQLPQLA